MKRLFLGMVLVVAPAGCNDHDREKAWAALPVRVGDEVYFGDGFVSQTMTVEAIDEKSGKATCVWWASKGGGALTPKDYELKKEEFSVACLRRRHATNEEVKAAEAKTR